MESGFDKIDRIRKAPRTDDERWKKLLELMAVPSHVGVYVLGCFARHVTFYSQQVRALNLIDALCKTGLLAEGSTVGVVGAGLAGLTAAAAALRRGLCVHLFQKDDDPQIDPGRMPLQKNSDERWVDPFVYDWPHVPEAAVEERTAAADGGPARKTFAGLPLLDWEAQTASEVRGQVLEDFRKVVAEAEQRLGAGRISFHQSKVTEDRLERVGGRWSVKVDEDSEPVVVNVLVLALGFGVEDSPPTRDRYWTNDGLAGNQADRKRYLISGVGDGGLTDVMRLCVADFKHRTVLDKFKNAAAVGGKLKEAVKNRRPGLDEYFLQEAGNVGVSPEDEKNLLASRQNEVYVSGSPEMIFGADSKASILNRLIVAWLFRRERFKLVDAKMRRLGSEEPMRRVEFGRWEKDEADPSPTVWGFRDGAFVQTGEAPPHEYHEVIVRYGPGRVLGAARHKVSPLEECFPDIWEKSKDNRDFWEEMPHWDDWTRRSTWGPDDFTNPPPLDPPTGKGLTYLVVEHTVTKGVVQGTLSSVIDQLHETDDPTSRPTLITLNLAEEFQTPHRFGRAVRALCRADIVVFDLTVEAEAKAEAERCPEAFILLGIRSVARRGITIVTTRFKTDSLATDPEKPPPEPHESDAPFAVPEMPFLLRDINFCGWRELGKFDTRLKKAIEEGRARAERLGLIYRDLPAYEEVRQLGPEPEDYRVQGPDKVVLFLSPLNEKYRASKGAWLRARTRATKTGMSVVESPSPEGTNIKLYSAIRRTQLCVVDWTERRPNVFFELGVRLAVSPNPPVCVVHKGDPSVAGEGRGGVFDLFKPLVYDEAWAPAEWPGFEQKIQRRKSALNRTDSAAEWPLNDAALSPNFVYGEVRAAVPLDAEDWNVPVWEELRTRANLILGSRPGEYPDPPILFGDDPDFKRQAGRSGIDRMLAAWYFLERRHDMRKKLEDGFPIEKNEEPWKSWAKIGRSILSELEYEKPPSDYARMREEVSGLLVMLRRKK